MQYLYDLIWPISSRDNAEKNDCLQDQVSCEGPPVTWQQRTVLVLKHMFTQTCVWTNVKFPYKGCSYSTVQFDAISTDQTDPK